MPESANQRGSIEGCRNQRHCRHDLEIQQSLKDQRAATAQPRHALAPVHEHHERGPGHSGINQLQKVLRSVSRQHLAKTRTVMEIAEQGCEQEGLADKPDRK